MRSRRRFLQDLTTAAAALALDPLRGVSAFASEYSNARLGLSVRLPRDWEFSSIADFVALRERQVLQDVLDGLSDVPHPLKDPANLPVFIFEDPRDREGEFTPSIILYDEPLDETVPADEPAAHAWMLRQLGYSYRDLQVTEEPREISLRGARASCSRCSYVHEIDSGESHPLDVRTLLVFRPPRVHTYYMVDSATRPRIHPVVWDDFMSSVEYAR
jgi:hypothetical protein